MTNNHRVIRMELPHHAARRSIYGCVRVALEDSKGKQVANTSGPFPLAGAKDPQKGFCLTQTAPGFAYFNIPAGEYLLKWLDKKGNSIRSHVLRVGVDRISVVVN